MRSPEASDPAIISSSDLTARSTSSAFRCDWRRARISISSDLVISDLGSGPIRRGDPGTPGSPRSLAHLRVLLGLVAQLRAQQRTQAGGTGGGFGSGLVVLG